MPLDKLIAVRKILDRIEVHGEQNMVWLLGSIHTLDEIIEEVQGRGPVDPAE